MPARSLKYQLILLLLLPCLLAGTCPALAQSNDDLRVREAEALATEAKIFFKSKLFDKAAQKFLEAYTRSKSPALLYNAARAYQEAKLYPQALAIFQEYRQLPAIGDGGRRDADQQIAEINQQLQVLAQAQAEQHAREAKDQDKRDREIKEQARQERERQERLAREREQRNHDEGGKNVRDSGVPKVVLTPRPRQVPWLEVAASTSTLGISLITYLVARHEADLAFAMDGKVQTSQDITLYLAHANNATTWRAVSVGALAAGVLIAGYGAGQWLRRPEPAAANAQLFVVPIIGGAQATWSLSL